MPMNSIIKTKILLGPNKVDFPLLIPPLLRNPY